MTQKSNKLVHSRHSFKLLPHHHTHYTSVVGLLVAVGLFSLGWLSFLGGVVSADESYVVRAVIPAQPLTQPATIDSPTDQTRFTNQNIAVVGSCPPDSYVKLQRNGQFAGSAICDQFGQWSLQLALVAGNNVLQAQVYNYTDQAGPSSVTLTVVYDPPIIPAPDDTTPVRPQPADTPTDSTIDKEPTTDSGALSDPLTLSGDFRFYGVNVGNELRQTFLVGGGRAPYAISVDWGDGTTDLLSQTQAGSFSVSHRYGAPGSGERNSYVITISVSDADGHKSRLQTSAIVTDSSSNGGVAGLAIGQTLGGQSDDTVIGGMAVYRDFWVVTTAVYVISLIGAGGFWIGQQFASGTLQYSKLHIHKH